MAKVRIEIVATTRHGYTKIKPPDIRLEIDELGNTEPFRDVMLLLEEALTKMADDVRHYNRASKVEEE